MPTTRLDSFLDKNAKHNGSKKNLLSTSVSLPPRLVPPSTSRRAKYKTRRLAPISSTPGDTNSILDISHSGLWSVTSSRGRLVTAVLLCFVIFTVTKNSSEREWIASQVLEEEESAQLFADRHNCQIICILGVEGSAHHGFTPVLELLARRQIDPESMEPFQVSYANKKLRGGLFGFYNETRTLDDSRLVRHTLRRICAPDNKKHVIIEDTSFPSGTEDDVATYRIHRENWWREATMEEIAMSETALNHPTNLRVFYESYSPYADIKFIVLHRSYIETIASHWKYDGTAERHSNVIGGFLLLLRRFLDSLPVDNLNGQRLWTLVCVERLMSKYYKGNEFLSTGEQLRPARQHILSHLVQFLGWPQAVCPDCFSLWRDGAKNPVEQLGENITIILEQSRQLAGIWPPPVENALPEQHCSLSRDLLTSNFSHL